MYITDFNFKGLVNLFKNMGTKSSVYVAITSYKVSNLFPKRETVHSYRNVWGKIGHI